MNDKEKSIQAARLTEYDRICKMETEILSALKAIESDSNGPFTGNSSRVKSVIGITIKFDNGPVEIQFSQMRGLKGYTLHNVLRPVFERIHDEIWKIKNEL